MKVRRPNDHVLNWVVRTTTATSPEPSDTSERLATHGSGAAAVGPVQSATATPLRNTDTAAGGVPPTSLASMVNVAP